MKVVSKLTIRQNTEEFEWAYGITRLLRHRRDREKHKILRQTIVVSVSFGDGREWR